MWQSVTSQAKAEELMNAFGYFHDGCIRDVFIWGGYYVSPDLTMTCPETPDLKCRVLVQRQCNNPAAVELLFDGVSQFSLAAPAGYDRIIMSATLRVEEGRIVWSPDSDFHESSHEFRMSSSIVAARLWWRPVADGLGVGGKCAQFGELPSGLAL